MGARAFSHERKCAEIKDANTEHIQAECIFFAFLPVFDQKVLSAKTVLRTYPTYCLIVIVFLAPINSAEKHTVGVTQKKQSQETWR
mgnify:CR=1 FL=1